MKSKYYSIKYFRNEPNTTFDFRIYNLQYSCFHKENNRLILNGRFAYGTISIKFKLSVNADNWIDFINNGINEECKILYRSHAEFGLQITINTTEFGEFAMESIIQCGYAKCNILLKTENPVVSVSQPIKLPSSKTTTPKRKKSKKNKRDKRGSILKAKPNYSRSSLNFGSVTRSAWVRPYQGGLCTPK